MWKTWPIDLKKTKTKLIFLLSLVGILITASGFMQANIQDHAGLLNHETRQLIEEKNNRYLQTKEAPQIVVITQKRLNHLTPPALNKAKKTAFIVIGKKGKKKNIELFSSKDLHSAFTAESRMNIIRAAISKLRSNNPAKFNSGVRFVFRACATKIDQQYQYALDKYDLTNQEQEKINHPRKVALPIALAIAFLVMFLIYFLRQIRNKAHKQS